MKPFYLALLVWHRSPVGAALLRISCPQHDEMWQMDVVVVSWTLFGSIIRAIVGEFLIEARDWRYWPSECHEIAWGVHSSVFLPFERNVPSKNFSNTRPPNLGKRLQILPIHPVSTQMYRRSFSYRASSELKMLSCSLIMLLICPYMAVMYGLPYLLYTTYPLCLRAMAGFSSGTAGVALLEDGVSTLLELPSPATQSDKGIRNRISSGGPIIHKTNTQYYRIVAQTCNAIIVFGMIATLTCIQTNLIDAFTIHAALATASNTLLRSLLRALFPCLA
ncbi:hypothetical protein F1880_006954 [Penicillium rolfsii]|nr:hypothetical protein F1880_006954 [Penicillium rolfsii]